MRQLYPCLLLLATLVGCDTSSPEPDSGIAGRIHLQASEWIDGSKRTLQLTFRDEGQYPCANYGLTTDYKQDGKTLAVAFTGVTPATGMCLTAIGPAKSAIDISALATGTYTLRFTVGSATTAGTLEIQDKLVRLSSSNADLVAVATPELRFTPTNLVWGYATTALPAAQASAETLRDSLQRLGAIPTTLPAGLYSRFTISTNGLPEPPQVSAGARALLFLATYQGAPERIQAFVKRANAATPGLNLWLNTTGG